MKMYACLLTLALIASPCFAMDYPSQDGVVLLASADRKKDGKSSGGKVVIKGKGGKVTDVKKKPGKKSKQSK